MIMRSFPEGFLNKQRITEKKANIQLALNGSTLRRPYWLLGVGGSLQDCDYYSYEQPFLLSLSDFKSSF